LHDDVIFASGAIGYPRGYFEARACSIDTRGPTRIAGTANFGLRVHTYSVSHHPAKYGEGSVLRPVVIDDHAWIASDTVLYNCHVGEGAVVSVGSVVRSRDVPPWTMVEGNPARIIAHYDHERSEWIYLKESEPLPMTAGWKGKTE
jgi:acetyltransferase-like isoleucine patch superfamily enzyme